MQQEHLDHEDQSTHREDSTLDDMALVRDNWQRYEYGVQRGHRDYTIQAAKLEGMYMGGGEQWSDEDLAILEEQGRPAYEFNEIKPAVEAAVGYQINNRMDIAFRPRSGEATKEMADIRSKVAMQIADRNNLHWKETEVFSDGMIEQRGFYDVRMCFEKSMLGELSINVLDPRDVIPDPDAKSYDPEHWRDVVFTRWMSLDEIEGTYGQEARERAEESQADSRQGDFGEDDMNTAERNKFGVSGLQNVSYDAYQSDRIRVVERQKWVREVARVAVYPQGDIRPIDDSANENVMRHIQAEGAVITRRRVRRVRWTVTTYGALLHDDWSPYDRFTVVPFFPYFRRGKTRGMVDNAVGPQESLNKATSQFLHIINTTANSGWQVEEGQLTNMTTEDLEQYGSSTGLVLERKAGTSPLRKIDPNQVPTGVDRIIDRSAAIIKSVTVPDALRGNQGAQESGLAIQSRQHAAQQVLAVPLDSLSRTRAMLARWIDYAITKYYDTERIFRITRTDALGKETEDALVINHFDDRSGQYVNDMTAGEYDVVVSEQPLQITFENSQFQQVLEMLERGIGIPPHRVVQYSNLSDRYEIAEEIMQHMQAQDEPQDAQPEPLSELDQAEAELKRARANLTQAQTAREHANAEKIRSESVAKSVEGMYSATQAAGNIAVQPHLSPLADELLRSAGFEDKSAAPIVPEAGQVMPDGQAAEYIEPDQVNTNPITPVSPVQGMNEGIQSPGAVLPEEAPPDEMEAMPPQQPINQPPTGK